MDKDEFIKFLTEKSIGEKTIGDYSFYLSALVKNYGLDSWDELVKSKEQLLEYIQNLMDSPMSLSISSAKSCRRALCLLYEYKHLEKIDKKLFPKWDYSRLMFPESAEGSWCQVIIVDKPHEWLGFVARLNQRHGLGARSWAFRGQGDATWKIETSLGRVARYSGNMNVPNSVSVFKNDTSLRLFEKETMWEFKRESSKKIEYRGLKDIDLLALVQHYGGKTRLLDFSLAPLLALYMSVEQNEIDFAKAEGYAKQHQIKKKLRRPDFAVWAVDLNRLDGVSGKNNGRTVEDMLEDARATLRNEETPDKGIHVVFPETCNERISAQEGLFLMPKSLSCSFEENLRYELAKFSGSPNEFPCKKLTEYVNGHPRAESPIVLKFVFSGAAIGAVKQLLAEANVTAKHVYPDLMGLGRYVSNIIEEHCREMDSKEVSK